LFVCLISILI